jgi:hypothetical protein
MRQTIHHHFNQLTEAEQNKIGDAFYAMMRVLSPAGLHIANADTAERVVDAIARGILETREKAATDTEKLGKAVEFLREKGVIKNPT